MKTLQSIKKTDFLYPSLVVIIAFALFYPSLLYGYFIWDDNIYVQSNSLIRSLNFENIKEIFSGFYYGNYHPLTLI